MNEIHPTAIIGDNVKLGKGNRILPYTIIIGPTEIGDDNIIGPHVVIGSPGQDTRNKYYDSSNSFIKIGDRNIIREFTAIQKPCYEEITLIGNDVFLMQSVHIPHDAQLGDKVVITPMCVLAGITKILEGANLGMGATINQYCIIGQFSIVATGAAVMKNVKPFSRFIPGKEISVNDYAIKKYGFENQKDEITKYVLEGVMPKSEIINQIIQDFQEKHMLSKRELY
jgi:UDP-N-acetylglucosamine acyltransferase